MKNNFIELEKNELININGGGIIYDIYRIIKEEGEDFAKGFKDGLNKGAF